MSLITIGISFAAGVGVATFWVVIRNYLEAKAQSATAAAVTAAAAEVKKL